MKYSVSTLSDTEFNALLADAPPPFREAVWYTKDRLFCALVILKQLDLQPKTESVIEVAQMIYSSEEAANGT